MFEFLITNTRFSKRYINIILNAIKQERNKSKTEYYENHHIQPKSLKGINIPENMILLTAREHYIAHKLLYLHFKKLNLKNALLKMEKAFLMISFKNDKYISSKEYLKLKKIAANSQSMFQKEILPNGLSRAQNSFKKSLKKWNTIVDFDNNLTLKQLQTLSACKTKAKINPTTGKSIHQETGIKAAKTRTKINPITGRSINQETGIKISKWLNTEINGIKRKDKRGKQHSINLTKVKKGEILSPAQKGAIKMVQTRTDKNMFKTIGENISKAKKNQSKEQRLKIKELEIEGKLKLKLIKIIGIFNKNDEIIYISYGFPELKRKYKLPIDSFRASLINNTRLYRRYSDLTVAKRKGYENFQGWYAKELKRII